MRAAVRHPEVSTVIGVVGELLFEYVVSQLAEALIMVIGRQALRVATHRVVDGAAVARFQASRGAPGRSRPAVHVVGAPSPGRIRLAVPGLSDNPSGAAPILARLRALPGIRSVTANPLTGNALVLYEPGCTTPAALRAVLAADATCNGLSS